MTMMKQLKMELIQLNESIDMITMQLDMQHDEQLVERLQRLLDERKSIITKLEGIN